MIACEEVRVEMSQNWDAVFEAEYNLMTLAQIEAFIEENKHLPHIPSGQELIQGGVSLAKMNSELLRTVEELTLHLIALKEQVDELESQIKK